MVIPISSLSFAAFIPPVLIKASVIVAIATNVLNITLWLLAAYNPVVVSTLRVMQRILIIEDDSLTRWLLREILEESGFTILEAPNGLMGVPLAKSYQPDLIICDIKMPELDGFQVLSEIRQSAETKTIPFVFLTGKADLAELRKGISSGADGYLIKPLSMGKLLGEISSILKKCSKPKGRKSAYEEFIAS